MSIQGTPSIVRKLKWLQSNFCALCRTSSIFTSETNTNIVPGSSVRPLDLGSVRMELAESTRENPPLYPRTFRAVPGLMTSAFYIISNLLSSLLFSSVQLHSSPLQYISFSGTATCSKLRIKRWWSLRITSKRNKSIALVVFCSFLTFLVTCKAFSCRPDRMKCPRWSIFSKKRAFFQA